MQQHVELARGLRLVMPEGDASAAGESASLLHLARRRQGGEAGKEDLGNGRRWRVWRPPGAADGSRCGLRYPMSP